MCIMGKLALYVMALVTGVIHCICKYIFKNISKYLIYKTYNGLFFIVMNHFNLY